MSACQRNFILLVVVVGLVTFSLWMVCGLGYCTSIRGIKKVIGFTHDVSEPTIKPMLNETGFVCLPRPRPVFNGTDATKPNLFPSFKWENVKDLTSAIYSDYKIINEKEVYYLCDRLELIIQARDGYGRPKQYGGDYFRAKIITQNSTFSASSATDGEVIDLGNGTYMALFTLKWTGKIEARVTLVHPSEAVYVIRRFRDAVPARYIYRGKFVSADGTKTEETFCNLALHGNPTDLCDFTDKMTGSPWFCYKPKSANLNCSDWREHRCDTGAAYRLDASSLSSQDVLTLIPKRDIPTKLQIKVGNKIKNSSEISALENTTKKLRDLPVCTIANHRIHINDLVSGHYSKNIWYNPSCRFHTYALDEMRSCVSRKKLYFLGDSTIRQLFEFYLKRLGPGLQKTPPGPEPRWHVGPTRALDQIFNISMMFRFHAFPIGRNAWATVGDIHYIANELDSIVADENTVVIISLWAHFTQQPEWFFVQRVRTIMVAVAHLQQRSPSTLVVFKGANTREHTHVNHRLYHSDWLARRMEYIIRSEISENVAFMDSWSMSYSQLTADNVHPGGSHVENLSNQLLTFMCGA